MTSPLANPVGFLQEFCQKHGTAFPNYTECGYSGPDHCREFSYQCTFAGQQVVAKSCQKKHAKTEAAKRMVELLEKNNYFESFDLDVATNKTDTSKSAASGSQSVQNVVAGPLKNPISMLQEYCQQKVFTLPHYSVSATSRIGGSFVCECSLGEFKTSGIDSTKKLAKIEAAAKMCEELQIVNISKLSETSLSPFNQNVKEEKFQPSEKNAISELQELCDFKKQPKPVYEDRAMFMGYFVVICMMGSTQAEGRGVTKKGAKLNAAQKVLRQIQHNNMSKHVNRSNGTLMDCTDSSSTISQLDNYSSSTISQLDFSIKSLLKNIGDSKSPTIEEYKFYKKENPTPILEEYNFDEEESPQTTQIPSASLSVEDSVVEIKPSSMPSKLISTSTIVESAIRVKDEPNLFSTPGISKINNGEEKSTHSEEQDTILMPFQTVKLENSDTKHETSTPEPKVSTFPKKESNYSEPVKDKATSSPLKKPQESASERAARIEVLLKKHLWNSESTTNLDPHLKSVFVPDRLDSTPETPHQNDKTNHTYSREFLLECAASKNSKTTPPNWDKIVKRSPSIINQNSQKHPTSETLKVWAKNDQSGGYKL